MSKPRSPTWPIWLGLLAFAMWALYALFALTESAPAWVPEMFRLPPDDKDSVLSRRGQFGDAFGAFNALISTFALIGLFVTIRSQQEQLREQSNASRTSERLTHQQQFQEQYYRAVDAYRSLLADFTLLGAAEGGGPVHGRAALWLIWRSQLVAKIRPSPESPFGVAVQKQIDAYEHEGLGQWNSNSDFCSAMEGLQKGLEANAEDLDDLKRRIGRAWTPVYGMHRYQFDSLFRSWYTVYRILESAPDYELTEEAIRLYAAIYRAQLSWIEMAFLLINQSGLPGNPTFPRACHHTNRFAVFDNLDVDNDAVVKVLACIAQGRASPADRESSILDGRAFKSA